VRGHVGGCLWVWEWVYAQEQVQVARRVRQDLQDSWLLDASYQAWQCIIIICSFAQQWCHVRINRKPGIYCCMLVARQGLHNRLHTLLKVLQEVFATVLKVFEDTTYWPWGDSWMLLFWVIHKWMPLYLLADSYYTIVESSTVAEVARNHYWTFPLMATWHEVSTNSVSDHCTIYQNSTNLVGGVCCLCLLFPHSLCMYVTTIASVAVAWRGLDLMAAALVRHKRSCVLPTGYLLWRYFTAIHQLVSQEALLRPLGIYGCFHESGCAPSCCIPMWYFTGLSGWCWSCQ